MLDRDSNQLVKAQGNSLTSCDAWLARMATSAIATTLFIGTVWNENGLHHWQMDHLGTRQTVDSQARMSLVLRSVLWYEDSLF